MYCTWASVDEGKKTSKRGSPMYLRKVMKSECNSKSTQTMAIWVIRGDCYVQVERSAQLEQRGCDQDA